MKNLTAKYLSLMMLASLLSGNAVQASHDGYVNGGDCCPRQYECGCNPLYCGAWDIQVQAGVAPVTWRNRGPFTAINCGVLPPAGPVVTLFTTPRFSRFYKTPWIVGAQIGYAMSDNTRVFLEFDYTQASRKSAVVITNDFTTPAGTTTFTFGKFKLFEGYVGARYYWDRWCDHLSFFLGGKIGFVHHKRQRAEVVLTFTGSPAFTLPGTTDFNRNSSVVSGGGHIGLDYCICGNWSLVLTGEVVASCGPRGVGAIRLAAPGVAGFTDIFTPSIGTALRFPVTLAVRYSF